MKSKNLLFILCCLIFLSGCNQNQVNNEKPPKDEKEQVVAEKKNEESKQSESKDKSSDEIQSSKQNTKQDIPYRS